MSSPSPPPAPEPPGLELIPWRAIVEDLTEMVVRWRPDGTRLFVNDAYCALFGLTRAEALGSPFWDLVAERDREGVQARHGALTPENPVTTGAHRVLTADGSERWMEWTDRALFDASGNLVELQSVGRDISERVALQRHAQRIEHAEGISRTSAAIAHDLSNLFNVLQVELELLEQGQPAPEALQSSRRCLEHGQALLHQLRSLRYGRVLEPQRFDLAQRVDGLLPVLRRLDLQGVRITVAHAEPALLQGDPTQLDQVLVNLVRNAAEAARQPVEVTLSVEQRDGASLAASGHRFPAATPPVCALLTVRDNAGGIPPELLPRIFDPAISTKPDGQGLGLATVKAIADAHGASIRVHTRPPHTRFELAFPLA